MASKRRIATTITTKTTQTENADEQTNDADVQIYDIYYVEMPEPPNKRKKAQHPIYPIPIPQVLMNLPPVSKYTWANKDAKKLWDTLKGIEVVKDEKILQLPEGVHFLGESPGPSTLFIRKCYDGLANVFFNRDIGKLRITGDPGIGKTFFGYYLLYLLALKG